MSVDPESQGFRVNAFIWRDSPINILIKNEIDPRLHVIAV